MSDNTTFELTRDPLGNHAFVYRSVRFAISRNPHAVVLTATAVDRGGAHGRIKLGEPGLSDESLLRSVHHLLTLLA